MSNGHEGECVLPEEGGEPDAPAACTKTEGCTLAEGHEGACVLPEEGGEPDAPAVSYTHLAINRYKMPMPPMTTRLAMTVQKVPFLVFHIP